MCSEHQSDKGCSVSSGHAEIDTGRVQNLDHYRPFDVIVVKTGSSIVAGWPPPPEGKQRALPRTADLNALQLDEAGNSSVLQIMDTTLQLDSASDVSSQSACVTGTYHMRVHLCAVTLLLLSATFSPGGNTSGNGVRWLCDLAHEL
jgi:hypothetical protein